MRRPKKRKSTNVQIPGKFKFVVQKNKIKEIFICNTDIASVSALRNKLFSKGYSILYTK